MKKILLLICLLLISSGCYDYTEVNNLALINGIYIDFKDNLYKVKLDVDKQVESSGTSISEAFYNVEKNISKKPYYAHIKVLVISSEILSNHFDEIIEFFLRNNEIRNNFYLLVGDNINIEIKSDYIKDIITNSNDVITSCLFKNILTTYLSNKKVILPLIDSNNIITGSIINSKNKIKKLDLDDTRLYKIFKNNTPNIIYKNIYIYHSKVKEHKTYYYISLDAELKETNKININKLLKDELEKLIGKKVVLDIDINRNGQILNEE